MILIAISINIFKLIGIHITAVAVQLIGKINWFTTYNERAMLRVAMIRGLWIEKKKGWKIENKLLIRVGGGGNQWSVKLMITLSAFFYVLQ